MSGESAYRWNASWTPTGYSFTIPSSGSLSPRSRSRRECRTSPCLSRIPSSSGTDTSIPPPQLVVEVLSPANTRREREEKIGDYARIGVPEVWVVSPEGRTVEILYLAEGYLRSAQVLREGVLTPKHFPGVQVEIARIWPE